MVCGNSLPAKARLRLFVCRPFLHFRADGVDCHHEDEQHQHAGQQGVAQVDGIVQPRVVERMGVDEDGLQERQCLPFGGAFCQQRLLSHGRIGKLGHGEQVLVEQRAGNEIGAVGVERHAGLTARDGFFSRAFGDVVECVDVAALHRLAGFGHVLVMGGDGSLLEGVQVAHDGTGGRGVVHVDHAHRQSGRQSATHQGGKEQVTEQGGDDHAEEV